MNQSIRNLLILVVLTLCDSLFVHCQSVTSARDGVWSDPSTWVDGIIPTPATASQVIIEHSVIIQDLSTVSVPRLALNQSLTLGRRASLHIVGDGNASTIDLRVSGTLISSDSATVEGISSSNAFFDDGSFYVHKQGPAGEIPLASWHVNSTFQVSGFTNSGYINIAHSSTWKQHFGNVIYDCPQQTVFVVDLNGYLSEIAGDFTIRNTNTRTLRLSTTQRATINIGGDLVIEGPSELWFSTSASSCIVNVSGDFNYTSTSSGPSYLTTRGAVNLNIGGNLSLNSTSPLRMCSSATDSSGTRQPSLSVSGDLQMQRGSIIAPPVGNGNATLIFNGSSRQHFLINAQASILGNMHYAVNSGATLDLGAAPLKSDFGSLAVRGTLAVGSTDPLGAIQLSNGGNINIPGPRVFESGSSIEYNASASQVIGNGHPNTGVNLVANNLKSLTLGIDLTNVGDISVERGKLVLSAYKLFIHGDVTFKSGAEFIGEFTLSGGSHQTVDASGVTLGDVRINKQGGGVVDLVSPLNIRTSFEIVTTNTTFRSNGFLTLLSNGDEPDESAIVATIPNASLIDGDVTVQRFMSGEGRIYRYLSSPLSNGTVETLIDDFPVTGKFVNPSTGPNINSTAASLFQYDESVGGLAAGWKPIPGEGLAADFKLQPGKGYAAFIREANASTIVDYKGKLSQGEILIPMGFTPGPGEGHGWNLVGNPYAATIGWGGASAAGWQKINVSEVIAIRDNGSGGIYHYTDGDTGDIVRGKIATGQSFWVRAIGLNPILRINEMAKVSQGAEFYRRRLESIPAFTLRLDQDTLSDIATFKIRREATDSLDRWDGIKLQNDIINLSWRNHGLPDLAIQANQRFPCNEEIPISITGVQDGKFTLTVDGSSGLETLDYQVIDHLYDSTTRLHVGQPIQFETVKSGRVATQARFGLIAGKPRLQPMVADLKILACQNKLSTLEVVGTVRGLSYSLWKEHRQLSDLIKCESTDNIQFHLKDSLDIFSLKELEVRVTSECGGRLTKKVAITTPMIVVDAPDKLCEGQLATLKASVSQYTAEIKWFLDSARTTMISDSSILVTKPLKKPVTYFVCGTLQNGCVTDLKSVTLDVKPLIKLDEVQSIADFDFKIPSASASPILLADTSRYDQQGVELPLHPRYFYSLKYNACVAIDSSELSLSESTARGISIFPNPVKDSFTIISEHSRIYGVSIMDSEGMYVSPGDYVNSVESKRTRRINCSKLPDGVYLALIRVGEDTECVRFIKAANGDGGR